MALAALEPTRMPELDPLMLSRIQFAFTISFHILLPGLHHRACRLAASCWRSCWLTTGKRDLPATSAASGSRSSPCPSAWAWCRASSCRTSSAPTGAATRDVAGNVVGPLMAYEVLTAFFLEAAFLGIMLFGRSRCRNRLHFVATVHGRDRHADLGLLDPVGQQLDADARRLRPSAPTACCMSTDWWQVIFNPSFPYRFAHMVAAVYLTTAFIVVGIGAWYILRGRSVAHGAHHARHGPGPARLARAAAARHRRSARAEHARASAGEARRAWRRIGRPAARAR